MMENDGPTSQSSSRSGIQRVKDPVDRYIEICPVKQFRRWGVALFPSSCTSCLFSVKLRPLLTRLAPNSRPLSLLLPAGWSLPTSCQNDGQSFLSLKKKKIIQWWKISGWWEVNLVYETTRGEKSGSFRPDVIPAGVKLSHQNLKQSYRTLKVQDKHRSKRNIMSREMPEHDKTSCHTHNGNKSSFQIKSRV